LRVSFRRFTLKSRYRRKTTENRQFLGAAY